jgi:farnesyl diphosphate synthase
MTFEEALAELEGVVTRLERGDVALDESIALYERGAALAQRCQQKLAEAEEKVSRITLGDGGQPTGTQPFDAGLTPWTTAPAARRSTRPSPARRTSSRPSTGGRWPGRRALWPGRCSTPARAARACGASWSSRARASTGIPAPQAAPVAAAIEAVHAYSLVHDDLPCMDDDDLRRGRPTVHRAWDEATAVLAGDALQALAFELIAGAELSAQARVALVLSLARAAGVAGMVGGQALDIAAETAPAPLTLGEITTLQARKTGALLSWSAAAGARMAGADPSALLRYGDALGLAFQIADDLLDVEGTPAETGKATGKDAAAGKATFVSLLGLEAARERARSLVEDACAALAPYGPSADPLREAARFVAARRR